MAGTSGTPLAQKLGIKPGFCIFVAGAPIDYARLVGKLPDGVAFASRIGSKGVDMIHVFATERATLARRLPAFAHAIEPDGMLWISWPKKASGLAGDLNDNALRELALPLGLVDVKVCAVDATWSGLKFVVRKALRRPG